MNNLEDQIKIKKIQKVGSKQLIIFIKDSVKAQAKEHTLKMKQLTILDSSRDNINYRNGILSLRTGIFRKREKSDFISRCLNYDYYADPVKYIKEIEHINTILSKFVITVISYTNSKKNVWDTF